MSASTLNDFSRWKKSIHKCPACARLLWLLPIEGQGVLYFCGWGPCPSLAANNGAASIELLRKNVDNEPEPECKDEDWP